MEVVFGFRLTEYEYIGNKDESQSLLSNSLCGKVLVLNQSYEPISICSPKKAIILLLLEKAEMISDRAERKIHTIRTSFAYPSVIKLLTYIRVPFKNVELSRKNVIRRDGNKCQYCGKKSVEMTIDHILPRSRGGLDTWENLITACVSCNNIKGNRTPEEADMKLQTKPRKPNHIMFLKQHLGTIENSWRPYLFMD